MSILDPCVGPGTFPSALARTGKLLPRDVIFAMDIDPDMIRLARRSAQVSVRMRFSTDDYLRASLKDPVDAVILNPPYIRQEWITAKGSLRRSLSEGLASPVPGTANLYVYFLVKALADLREGGRLVALVYDGWRHTKYGTWLIEHLSRSCEDVHVHEIDDTPFEGRLIDATVIVATKATAGRRGHLTPCKGIDDPLDGTPGLVPIEDQYETCRGLRLKQTSFFLCERDGVQRFGATPFVKKVRHVPGYRVSRDHPEAALLLETGAENRPMRVELERRLEAALENPDENPTIINWVSKRPQTWCSHSPPPVAPLLFNYYVRGRPRHLISPELAYSDNFYGLRPSAAVSPYACLAALNSSATILSLAARARNQGNGLRKIQLYEYRTVLSLDLGAIGERELRELAALGKRLAAGSDADPVLVAIDKLISRALRDDRLDPGRLTEMHKSVSAR